MTSNSYSSLSSKACQSACCAVYHEKGNKPAAEVSSNHKATGVVEEADGEQKQSAIKTGVNVE